MNDLSHSFIARRDLARHHIVIFDVEMEVVIKRCDVIVLTIAKHSQRPDATSDGEEKACGYDPRKEDIGLLISVKLCHQTVIHYHDYHSYYHLSQMPRKNITNPTKSSEHNCHTLIYHRLQIYLLS